MKISTLLTILFVCGLSVCASAQKGKNPGGISKDQQAKIADWQKSLDARIEKAFDGDEKLKQEMAKALKDMAAMKDAKAQAAAGAAYRQKYLKVYGGALSKANVNLEVEAGKLREIIPTYTVTIVDFQIIAAEETETPPAPPPPAGPKTVKVTGFEDGRTGGCGLGAGGYVNFTATSIKSFALAVLAGGCTNTGTKTKNLPIGDVQRATATIKFKADIDGFSVGVGGAANARPQIIVTRNDVQLYSLSAVYLAPMFWVTSGSQSFNKTLTTTLQPNQTAAIVLKAETFVLALLSPETHSGANITGIDVSLTTE